jgi:glycine/D-amino acid oxidase-like deaminating enzyme
MRPSVAVLGAGIQGVSAALALHRAGWRVELVDRASDVYMRTSLRGEGKLHLGYVYSNEPDRRTARLMVDGALAFSKVLDDWLPRPINWSEIRSQDFIYAVLDGSLLTPDSLHQHYACVDDIVSARLSAGDRYAGSRAFQPVTRLGDPVLRGYSGDVIAAFQTSEIAVDPHRLRAALVGALDAYHIPRRTGRQVQRVERIPDGFSVTTVDSAGNFRSDRTDAVVNCLWDGRLTIDATMGIPRSRPVFHRLKYAVFGHLATPLDLPTPTTFVLGPFGDVVCWSDGRVYLSWYPVCLAGVSTVLEPPEHWRPATDDSPPTAKDLEIASATVAALSARMPALRGMRIDGVKAGVVVAWGESDIDQRDSELHRRYDIGVHDHDGYLSVDTGKLTTAPLFAEHVVARLGAVRGSV